MKHIFTLFFSICFFTVATFSQAANDQAKVAKSENSAATVETLTLKEIEFNFGKIPQGKPVTHLFEAVNNGTVPLKISNVAASCGCTTPEWEKDKTIEPNGNTVIKVGYNAASAGTFAKTITITYNDSQTKVITIKGEVWATPSTSAPENKAIENLKNK